MPRPRPEEPMSNVSVKMPTRLRDALEASGAPSLSAAIVAACEAAIAGNATPTLRASGGIAPAPFTGDRPHPDSLPRVRRTDGIRDVSIEASVPPLRRVRPQGPPQAVDNPSGKRSYAPNPKGGKG